MIHIDIPIYRHTNIRISLKNDNPPICSSISDYLFLPLLYLQPTQPIQPIYLYLV